MRVLKRDPDRKRAKDIISFRVYDPFEGIETSVVGYIQKLVRIKSFRVYDPFEGIETG